MVSTKIVKTEIGQNFDKAIKQLHEKVAKVGWLEGIRYPDKETENTIIEGLPVATIAAIHEQGAPSKHIPARPFMRPTIIREENKWKRISEKFAKLVLIGQLTLADLMEKLGQSARGEVQKTISSIFSPALAQRTILGRLKRNSTTKKIKNRPLSFKEIGLLTKPLVDTGHMRDTIVNTVEDA